MMMIDGWMANEKAEGYLVFERVFVLARRDDYDDDDDDDDPSRGSDDRRKKKNATN
jgi:hypothetical protein